MNVMVVANSFGFVTRNLRQPQGEGCDVKLLKVVERRLLWILRLKLFCYYNVH